MNDKRTLQLAERINTETAKGNVNWVRSPFPNSYRLSLGSGMLEIDYTPEPELLPDNTFAPLYSFAVYNERNEVIDVIAVSEVSDSNYNLLKQIYSSVEANYLKKDKTYKSMFDALDIPF